MDPPLDSCEHEKRMRDGAVLLGRRVAVAVAAALCLSSLVGVLGAQAAGAALQSKSSVTVTVAVSPPTEVYGVLNQVFSVTVAPPAAGDVSPTGVVTVSDLGVDLCPPITLPAPGSGAVTVICADTTVPIPVNPLTIAEYSYSGDQNYLASKGRVSGAVTAADTTTSVIASSTTGTWGSEQSLVFTATVADSQSGSVGVPTGEVSVEQGADVLCTITLSNGAGTCSPAATALSPGSDPITASYGGDPNFNPSPLSSPIGLTISPASLVVTGDDAAMPYGSPLPTLGSTISGFVDGQTLATSGVTGQPQCTTAATITSSVGAYPITCTAGSLASSDYTFGFVPGTLTVSQATTTISLKSLTATVSSEVSGTPSGSVTFVVASGSYSCDLSSQTAGSASCTASVGPNIAPGNYSVSATYSGDANFMGSSIERRIHRTGDRGAIDWHLRDRIWSWIHLGARRYWWYQPDEQREYGLAGLSGVVGANVRGRCVRRPTNPGPAGKRGVPPESPRWHFAEASRGERPRGIYAGRRNEWLRGIERVVAGCNERRRAKSAPSYRRFSGDFGRCFRKPRRHESGRQQERTARSRLDPRPCARVLFADGHRGAAPNPACRRCVSSDDDGPVTNGD